MSMKKVLITDPIIFINQWLKGAVKEGGL